MTPGQLVSALRAEGHLAYGDHELPMPAGDGVPWYVAVLQGIGAWLAALFLLVATAALFQGVFDNVFGATFLAVLGIGCAWGLVGAGGGHVFAEQLALAVYLAGLAALAMACHLLLHRDIPAAVLFAFLCLPLGWLMPRHLLRFVTVLAALAGLAFTVGEGGRIVMLAALSIATVVLWLDEWAWTAAGLVARLRPAAQASAIFLALLPLFGSPWRVTPMAAPMIGGSVAPALLVAALYLTRRRDLAVRGLSLAAALGGALLASWAPGVPLGVLVALLAFAAGARALLGLGLAAAAAYLGVFYYQMQLPLLDKSLALAAAGLALLLLRAAPRRVSGSGHG